MLDLVIFAKLFPLTAGVSDNDSGDHLCAGSGDPCLTVSITAGVADYDSGDHLCAGSGDLCLTVILTADVADYDSGDHLCAGSGDPALRQDRWKIGNIFVI